MARGEQNSATHEFFICIGPQSSLDHGGLRNPDGEGFAAFGRVVGGMAVVEDDYVKNQIFAKPVEIISAQLLENAINTNAP